MKVDPEVKKIFTENEIIGMVADDAEYHEILMRLLYVLNEDYNKILYISITKPYKTLVKEFGENKLNLNKFIFVDCITKTSENPKSTENCIYVSSPKAIDEINTVVMGVLKKQKIDITLIDSPSDLLTHYEDVRVLQFMHRLMSELLVAGCKGVFPFQKESAGTLKRSVEMFTDVAAGLYIVETVLKIRILE